MANYNTKWVSVPHPLACIRAWVDEYPNVALTVERENLGLPPYVFDPWKAYNPMEWLVLYTD